MPLTDERERTARVSELTPGSFIKRSSSTHPPSLTTSAKPASTLARTPTTGSIETDVRVGASSTSSVSTPGIITAVGPSSVPTGSGLYKAKPNVAPRSSPSAPTKRSRPSSPVTHVGPSSKRQAVNNPSGSSSVRILPVPSRVEEVHSEAGTPSKKASLTKNERKQRPSDFELFFSDLTTEVLLDKPTAAFPVRAARYSQTIFADIPKAHARDVGYDLAVTSLAEFPHRRLETVIFRPGLTLPWFAAHPHVLVWCPVPVQTRARRSSKQTAKSRSSRWAWVPLVVDYIDGCERCCRAARLCIRVLGQPCLRCVTRDKPCLFRYETPHRGRLLVPLPFCEIVSPLPCDIVTALPSVLPASIIQCCIGTWMIGSSGGTPGNRRADTSGETNIIDGQHDTTRSDREFLPQYSTLVTYLKAKFERMPINGKTNPSLHTDLMASVSKTSAVRASLIDPLPAGLLIKTVTSTKAEASAQRTTSTTLKSVKKSRAITSTCEQFWEHAHFELSTRFAGSSQLSGEPRGGYTRVGEDKAKYKT